jgi:hypothetical protein
MVLQVSAGAFSGFSVNASPAEVTERAGELASPMPVGSARMRELARRIGASCVVLLSSLAASAQQPNFAPAMPPDVSAPDQISFLVIGDSNSVSRLVQLNYVQVRTGRINFIIVAAFQGGEVYNLGQVDSAASLIFSAGNHRYALPDSRFLIHSSLLRQAPRNTSERFLFSFR